RNFTPLLVRIVQLLLQYRLGIHVSLENHYFEFAARTALCPQSVTFQHHPQVYDQECDQDKINRYRIDFIVESPSKGALDASRVQNVQSGKFEFFRQQSSLA